MSGARRVIVQLPCHNEADALPALLAAIPQSWTHEGAPVRARILVIDDGSADETGAIARAQGAELLRLQTRRGLARAFSAGLERALALGAECVINLDGDGQYDPAELPALAAPILSDEAEMVLGARDVAHLPHFSWLKRRLQVLGTAVVRRATGLPISDATTGYRALSREAALRLHLHTRFTFTMESLFQAAQGGWRILERPAAARPVARTSRLAPTMAAYLWRSLTTGPRLLLLYRPLATFAALSLLLFLPGLALGLRAVSYHLAGVGGHLQSLILTALLILLSFGALMLGFLGEVIAGQRRLAEETLYRLRSLELRGLGEEGWEGC